MQKIITNLWFKSNEDITEAINLYTSLFNGKILSTQYYTSSDFPRGKEGDILTIEFELNNQKYIAINGGPGFDFTPAISLSVECESEEQINNLYNKLVEDGSVLMELQKYDFSEKYAWIQDKFGLSWQLSLTKTPLKITPSFLFVGKQAGKAEEAINLYTSLFPDSKINMISRYQDGNDKDRIMYAQFELFGQTFAAMDSGLEHKFTFNEAVSLMVDCKDQQEVDFYWNKLTGDGGEESMCGWLKDKFGVSWQIVPTELNDLLNNSDKDKAVKAVQAMLQMQKIDIQKIKDAVNN